MGCRGASYIGSRRNATRRWSPALGLLRQYGERFQIDRQWQHSDFLRSVRSSGSAEDVAAGRAIFSLAGQGAARVFPLPYLPTGAKWLALKDDATSQTVLDPRTNQPTTVVSYDQDGVVWQAEEVQVGGTWKRYFGFVGRHCLAKVPAAEIDFSRDAGPSARIAGLDVVALEPGGSDDTLVGDSLPWIGGPLPVVVLVRNDTGLDRPLPRFVIDGAGVAKPRDSIGVRLSLSYADRQPRRIPSSTVCPVLPGGIGRQAARLARAAPQTRLIPTPLR